MHCCVDAAHIAESSAQSYETRAREFESAAQISGEGQNRLRLAAPDMHCGGCVLAIEKSLRRMDGVLKASANLTAKTISVEWRGEAARAAQIAHAVEQEGYRVFPLDDANADAADKAAAAELLRLVAVSGFAATNVMLLSVSVWAGAEGATRDLLHWISALIASPAIFYAGRPFFRSALAGLRRGRLNMDAPISVAIVLAAGVSISEVAQGGHDAYFDAAITLVFLLLLGRWLDAVMRAKARSAARMLARKAPRGAWVRLADGAREYRNSEALRPSDRILLAPGDQSPVDGVIETGAASVDRSLLTGESMPVRIQEGATLEAGVTVLDGALTLRATSDAESSTLAEISGLVAAAEERKSHLARLADQAAAIYAPVVHVIALVVALGWFFSGSDARAALLAGVAVLIVTCPCALGLAAPMAQAVANGVLFRRGVMVKDGAALERLALAKVVAFDKTGVLTMGRPHVSSAPHLSTDELNALASLSAQTRHPLGKALYDWSQTQGAHAGEALQDVREFPGEGVSAKLGDAELRLGAADFCRARTPSGGAQTVVWFGVAHQAPKAFYLSDTLRDDAAASLQQIRACGAQTHILSGDHAGAVEDVAQRVGGAWRAGLRPEEKIEALEGMHAHGGVVAMVGDGLNDAPALARADVSIAPANASDVGRAAADIVFTGASLRAVADVMKVARSMRLVILQNFALAAAYNLVAIPAAAMGFVGPLEAAVAMSTSSLLVTLNALRIKAPSLSSEGEKT